MNSRPNPAPSRPALARRAEAIAGALCVAAIVAAAVTVRDRGLTLGGRQVISSRGAAAFQAFCIRTHREASEQPGLGAYCACRARTLVDFGDVPLHRFDEATWGDESDPVYARYAAWLRDPADAHHRMACSDQETKNVSG